MERRREVHGERRSHSAGVRLLDRREVPHDRIVHQDVDAAEARRRGGDEPFDLREIRDVGLLDRSTSTPEPRASASRAARLPAPARCR